MQRTVQAVLLFKKRDTRKIHKNNRRETFRKIKYAKVDHDLFSTRSNSRSLLNLLQCSRPFSDENL